MAVKISNHTFSLLPKFIMMSSLPERAKGAWYELSRAHDLGENLVSVRTQSIADNLGFSASTARRALKDLLQNGYIISVDRSGVYKYPVYKIGRRRKASPLKGAALRHTSQQPRGSLKMSTTTHGTDRKKSNSSAAPLLVDPAYLKAVTLRETMRNLARKKNPPRLCDMEDHLIADQASAQLYQLARESLPAKTQWDADTLAISYAKRYLDLTEDEVMANHDAMLLTKRGTQCRVLRWKARFL